MRLAARRRKRQQLYRLLAAMHSGPLGYQLVPQVRQLARELFGLEDLPAPAPASADHYPVSYGFCPGNTLLGCKAAAPAACLPRKLLGLADSAGKGASKRRRDEAALIRRDLVTCLETAAGQMARDGYRDLVALSRAVVLADAEWIDREPDPR